MRKNVGGGLKRRSTSPNTGNAGRFLKKMIIFAARKVEGLNGRVVYRSNNNANANGGLVYANANNASSNSNTNIGTRLTLSTTA